MRWTVTLTNGSGEDFDPALFSVTASSGQKEAAAIFDSVSELMGPPMTTVRAGRSVQFDYGFRVAEPKDVTVEVAPSYDHDPGLWSNS